MSLVKWWFSEPGDSERFKISKTNKLLISKLFSLNISYGCLLDLISSCFFQSIIALIRNGNVLSYGATVSYVIVCCNYCRALIHKSLKSKNLLKFQEIVFIPVYTTCLPVHPCAFYLSVWTLASIPAGITQSYRYTVIPVFLVSHLDKVGNFFNHFAYSIMQF